MALGGNLQFVVLLFYILGALEEGLGGLGGDAAECSSCFPQYAQRLQLLSAAFNKEEMTHHLRDEAAQPRDRVMATCSRLGLHH